MKPIRITFTDGTVIETNINGTEEEIKAYYIGQPFTLGPEEYERHVTGQRVEFLDALEAFPMPPRQSLPCGCQHHGILAGCPVHNGSELKIQNKALLVRLSIALPPNTRNDKKLSEEMKLLKALGKNAGKWLKTLYPPEIYDPLTKIQGEIRTWHYKHSLPWSDNGWDIITAGFFPEYTAHMRQEAIPAFEAAKAEFLAKYDECVSWARKEHNGTFNESEYPGQDKTAKRFKLDTKFQQIPEGSDFRVQIQNEDAAAIMADIDGRVSQAVNDARLDLWKRLAEPLEKMVERLSDKENTFRDSLVENVKEIVDLIPALNLTGDAQLERFRMEAQEALYNVSPDLLRSDDSARRETAARAKEILSRMAGYMA